jgi:uncharacterized membrane protein YbaN (DUF454 family)
MEKFLTAFIVLGVIAVVGSAALTGVMPSPGAALPFLLLGFVLFVHRARRRAEDRTDVR